MIDSSREIETTLSAVRKNYRSRLGVCGVSIGSKFTESVRQNDVQALQFFVTEKIPLGRLTAPLPKYVLARDRNGKADRRRRLTTDVIELKNLKLCCQSGTATLNEIGIAGTVALMFEDKTDGVLKFLSCSHVVSDLIVPNSAFDLSGGGNGCFFQARSLFNTVVEDDELEFDIALAELTQIDAFVDGAVNGSSEILTRFADETDLAIETELNCTSRVSGQRKLTIESKPSEFEQIQLFSGDTIRIRNLYACKGLAVQGDSGGIVFRNGRAVGMIVASADDDWVFIHSLEDAAVFLAAENGIQLRCFD